jgi:PAS domain-containing protein
MNKSESKSEKVKKITRKTTSQITKEIAQAKDILEAIGAGISIQDRTFKIVYANEVHREAFGDNIGEYCYKVYQKREGICGGCPVALTFKDGKTHTVHRKIHTDEGIGYVEITASPLRDSTGKTIAGIEIVRDITERKQIEEALKLNEERYRSFVQKFKGIAYQAKMDWIPIFFHGNVEEITGYTEDEFVAGNP